MLAAVAMCTHFRAYLCGAQFTLRTDHSSLRWLQIFLNSDGMLARWYMLLGQFSVTCTFEYRPVRRNVDHGTSVGTDGYASSVVRMFGTIARVTLLAIAVREYVRRHGRAVVAALGSPGNILAACGAWAGTSGTDSSIS